MCLTIFDLEINVFMVVSVLKNNTRGSLKCNLSTNMHIDMRTIGHVSFFYINI